MLDHVTLGVADLRASAAFYDAVLGTLGIVRLHEEGDAFVGYGVAPKAFFWIGRRSTGAGPGPMAGAHVAFTAGDRGRVDRFHAAALLAGGRDHGGPGVRAHYHPHYYGAFVLDLDGHNVEAVCHVPT